jgi:hypothetical protein
MNLGNDVVTFWLLPIFLVFFWPLKTWWLFWRWGYIGGDVYNIKHLYPIVVKVVNMFFWHIPNMNEGKCIMMWVLHFVQIKNFMKCILTHPWFTKNKNNNVISYELGNIMLDDAHFVSRNLANLGAQINKMKFIEMTLHLVLNCCKLLLLPYHEVFQYKEKQAT